MSLVLFLPLMNRQNPGVFINKNDPSSWESPRDICPFNDFIGRTLKTLFHLLIHALCIKIRHPLWILSNQEKLNY